MSSPPHEVHDEHAENDPHASMDTHMDDDLALGDHSFVDLHDFNFLVTRTATLETQVKTMNKNLTKMSDLLKELVRSNTLGNPGVSMATGGAVEPPLLANTSRIAEAEASTLTPDVPNMLKNMKPPSFKGEEKDRNKDAVNTFLLKWTDLHILRRTPDHIRALEASLSLEGKAYKWWMSLQLAERPNTWTQFQEAFRKEFLPENEADRNWAAWDQCRMDRLTLTQYVSKYRGIILKLEGLDDFQKVRGFLRGLNDEYKAKVKTQYPKTLEDAIKSAQIFDDNFDKPFIKSTPQISPFKNGKRKHEMVPKEDPSKKPKGAKGPLSSETSLRERAVTSCVFNALALTSVRIAHNLEAMCLTRTRAKRRLCTRCNSFLWKLVLSTRLCKYVTKLSSTSVVCLFLRGRQPLDLMSCFVFMVRSMDDEFVY